MISKAYQKQNVKKLVRGEIIIVALLREAVLKAYQKLIEAIPYRRHIDTV